MIEHGTSGWMQPLEPHQGPDPLPDYAQERAVYYFLVDVDTEKNPDQALAAFIRPVYLDVAPEVRAFAGDYFDIPKHLVAWTFAVKAPGDGDLLLQGRVPGTEPGFQLARQCCQVALGHGSVEHGYLVYDDASDQPPRRHVIFDRNGTCARHTAGVTFTSRDLLTVTRALPRDIRAYFRGASLLHNEAPSDK